MDDKGLSDRVATVALRPPRVALLFYGGAAWSFWARSAIQAASQIWGGGGFVYVPYALDGSVHSQVLKAVSDFDPDYVALLTGDASTWYRNSPEYISIVREPGQTEEELISRLELAPGTIQDGIGNHAAKIVIEACSPLTYGGQLDRTPRVYHLAVGGEKVNAPFISAPRTGLEIPHAALAAPASWSGDLALFTSARTGIPPSANNPQPQPSDGDLLGWLIVPTPDNAPEELLWHRSTVFSDLAKNHRLWFDAASPDLTVFHSGYSPDGGAIVIGETANDFALAVIYSRMLDWAIWLTPGAIKEHFVGNWMRTQSLETRIRGDQMDRPVSITSSSLDAIALEESIAGLTESFLHVTINDEPVDNQNGANFARRTPSLRDGINALGLSEYLGTLHAVPVLESADGTVEFRSPFIAPIPSDAPIPRPVDNNGGPAWLVDLTISPQVMPRGRGLHPSWIIDETDSGSSTMLRSSRAGVTFLSASHGFISSGTVLASRLVNPKIRELGMYPWVRAMAERDGVSARYSRPGQHAELVSKRLGSRERFFELTSGPFNPFLRAFVDAPKAISDADETEASGVVTVQGGLRYVTWPDLATAVPSADWQALRAVIDELIGAQLLRQGLILDCEECGGVSFVSMDDLGHRFVCARCGGANEFALARWKSKASEPPWFYDLHSAYRNVLEDHGDVVQFTAARLKATSHTYSDCAEVEFRQTVDEVKLFELDLVALTADGVVVVESKLSKLAGNVRERDIAIRKRFSGARLLRADKVVFATSASAWTPAVRKAIESIHMRENPELDIELLEGVVHG